MDPQAVTGETLRNVEAYDLLSAYYRLDKDHIAPLTTADNVVIPSMGLAAALADPEFAKDCPSYRRLKPGRGDALARTQSLLC